jgi:amino acid transporter
MASETIDSLKRIVIGDPLRTEDQQHQAISKKVGLAVFASDALSSTAYATQEILLVLSAAVAAYGTGVFNYSIPIAFVIIGILAILTVSYRQTIFAYPKGGGAYIVAYENLGKFWGMAAGAALLTDYILTAAVSISSGVDQVASAIPALRGYVVEVALLAIVVMTIINLRGVKESGQIFALPTYFFLAMTLFTLAVGTFQFFSGTLNKVTEVEMIKHTAQPLGLFLILYAFSSGCTALTGIEAISDGIAAFKKPSSRNAANTMAVMSLLLGILFIGITLLARQVEAVPSETNTVISQIGEAVFGRGIFYGLQIAATTVILIMAANTAYADFPRLAAFMAQDGFVPRQLGLRGQRLVFSSGIILLSVAAGILVILFQAKTSALIPLYAIGVFMSFTLSQAGMVLRWLRAGKMALEETIDQKYSVMKFDPQWRRKFIVSLLGAIVSFLVMVIFAVTKFREGAWITLGVMTVLIVLFSRIYRHYKDVARILSLGKRRVKPFPRPMKTVVLVDDVHVGTVRIVEFAKSLGRPWVGVHVDYNDRKTHVVQQKWKERIGEGELVILPSPYRKLAEPIYDYVKSELDKNPNVFIHVIMGQLVMDTPWARALHSNNALGILSELQSMDRVVVTDVPYQLHAEDAEDAPENESEDYEKMMAKVAAYSHEGAQHALE